MKLTKEQKAEALDELKMLRGQPPYNNWSNICAHDGYFAASLVRKYGMSIEDLERKVLE